MLKEKEGIKFNNFHHDELKILVSHKLKIKLKIIP